MAGLVEQRFETRRTFLEGKGHVVEEVPIGSPYAGGQSVVPSPPAAPPAKVVITVADVSLDIARQVCEAAGMVVVPANFLNPDQLAELKLPTTAGQTAAAASAQEKPQAPHQHDKAHKLNADEMIERVKLVASFEELNTLMADETRKTVINAAEARAEELKQQGAQ